MLTAHTARLEIGLDLQEGVLHKLHIRGPVGDHHEHVGTFELAGQEAEKIDGGFVRPVEVVEKKDQGSRARQLLDAGHKVQLQPLLSGFLHLFEKP